VKFSGFIAVINFIQNDKGMQIYSFLSVLIKQGKKDLIRKQTNHFHSVKNKIASFLFQIFSLFL